MAVPTYLEIADSLRQTVADIAAGKLASYSMGGRSFTYHNLKELAALEQEMRSLASSEDGLGVVTLADVRSAGGPR